MPDDVTRLGVEAGLCANCVHALVRPTRKGPVYLRCALAATDGGFAKYPALPVRTCSGHQPPAADPA